MHTLQDITILRDILWKIRITYTKQIRTFFKNETHTKPHVVITDDGYIEIKSHKDLGESINKFKEQFQLEYLEFELHTFLPVREENPQPDMQYHYTFRRDDFKKTNSSTTWQNNSLDDITLKFQQLTEQEIEQW